MSDKPLQVVGVEIKAGEAVRGAFDVAWTAADKAETLQRLEKLTRAYAVAPITDDVDAALTELDAVLGIVSTGSRAERVRYAVAEIRAGLVRLKGMADELHALSGDASVIP